jgi:nucleoid-associated protein YgaU
MCASFFLTTPYAIARQAQEQGQQAQDDQDVAKAARQEKARKAAQQKKTEHVYTNDDLKQSEILTGDDRARVEARKQDQNQPANKPAMPSFDVENSPAPESLGEIARRVRKETAARAAEEAAKSLKPLFPMNAIQPTFAIPVEPSEPIAPIVMLPWKNSDSKTLPKKSHTAPAPASTAPGRRDPFSGVATSAPNLAAPQNSPARPLVIENAAPHAPAAHVASPSEPALHLAKPSTAPSVTPTAPARPSITISNATPNARAAQVIDGSTPVMHLHKPIIAPPSLSFAPKPMAPTVVRRVANEPSAPLAPKSHITRVPPVPKFAMPSLGAAPSLGLAEESPMAPAAKLHAASSSPAKRKLNRSVQPNLPEVTAPSTITPSTLVAPSNPLKPTFTPSFVAVVPAAHTSRVGIAPAAPKIVLPLPQMPTLLAIAGPAIPTESVEFSAAPVVPSVNPVAPMPTAPIAPALPIAPVVDNTTPVRVRLGDSLWKLARRLLGNGNRWAELLAGNPGISNPNHIVPGTVLTVPASATRHEALPANSVAVTPGDSLWKLAAFYLGNGKSWTCIAKANPQVEDANRIFPGENLVIPDSCSNSR